MHSQHLESIRAALEMGQPCRCLDEFVCTRCKGLAAVDAMALEPMSRGIELIAKERTRQVAVEGCTPEHDAQHVKGELSNAAAYYCAEGPQEWLEAVVFPISWICGQSAKRQGFPMPTLRDLVKAGALIAAEIDRRVAAGEEA